MPKITVIAVGITAIITGNISKTIVVIGVIQELQRKNIGGFRVSVIVSIKEQTVITETTVISATGNDANLPENTINTAATSIVTDATGNFS